jgi:large subunit ribosomal protein L21
MYAIIQDGSRQHKVEEGKEFEIDYRDIAAGGEVTFDRVLAVGLGEKLKLGSPLVGGASVTGTVVGSHTGPKLVVQKMRRRKNSRRKNGHRQLSTLVKITKIAAG